VATVEAVGLHSDGQRLHAAELKNIRHALNGAGVLGHTITLTVTEGDRNISVPAFSAWVPNGSGDIVLVTYAGGTIAVTASAANPRMDLLVVNSAGTVEMQDGTATAETGTVREAPLPALDDDEILLAVVRSPGSQSNVLAADIRGRALDVSELKGTQTWEHIDTQTLTGTAASVSFQSISTAYRAFRLTAYIENDANAKRVYLRLNNDSGSNYDYQYHRATGATNDSSVATGQAQIDCAGLDMAASESGLLSILIVKPSAAQEALVQLTFTLLSGATAPSVYQTVGTWQNVADLISRIDLLANTNNFAASTRVTLEGSRSL
jgi:hypothetical protein